MKQILLHTHHQEQDVGGGGGWSAGCKWEIENLIAPTSVYYRGNASLPPRCSTK